MATLGRHNQLPVTREGPPGLFLDGGIHGEILMTRKYIPAGTVPGDIVDVFVYRDSEDRMVATTETPLAMVGDFAFLRVVSVNPGIGAFLDWGLAKDLLLPRREQEGFRKEGDWLVVHVLVDEKSDRIVASARLDRFLSRTPPPYAKDQPVKLLVSGETPFGYSAIIENAHRGLLYRAELAASLKAGQRLDGYVRAIRPDGKIDLALDRVGLSRIVPLTEQITETLRKNGGTMPIHDGSSPEEIRAAFGTSKKAFKQAVGALYRKRLIVMEEGGIRLVKDGSK